MSKTPEQLLKLMIKYAAMASQEDNLVLEGDAVKTAAKKEKKKPDPKAKVRNRGTVCVPAESAKDKKDHFPINDADQARNALARVHQYSSAPPWYNGSLTSLQNAVSRKIHSKYPSIGKDKKSAELYVIDELLNKYGQNQTPINYINSLLNKYAQAANQQQIEIDDYIEIDPPKPLAPVKPTPTKPATPPVKPSVTKPAAPPQTIEKTNIDPWTGKRWDPNMRPPNLKTPTKSSSSREIFDRMIAKYAANSTPIAGYQVSEIQSALQKDPDLAARLSRDSWGENPVDNDWGHRTEDAFSTWARNMNLPIGNQEQKEHAVRVLMSGGQTTPGNTPAVPSGQTPAITPPAAPVAPPVPSSDTPSGVTPPLPPEVTPPAINPPAAKKHHKQHQRGQVPPPPPNAPPGSVPDYYPPNQPPPPPYGAPPGQPAYGPQGQPEVIYEQGPGGVVPGYAGGVYPGFGGRRVYQGGYGGPGYGRGPGYARGPGRPGGGRRR